VSRPDDTPSRRGRTWPWLPALDHFPRLPSIQMSPAFAMRRVLRKGYRRDDLRADLLAGLVVGIVAIPLSMALAMAVGVPPQHGLYTAAIAGAITALLGGCKFQVTGPTAAFVVILAPIVAKHGVTGLLMAGFLAGLILIGLGLAGLGKLIRFVPYPVTTGFTTGIAVVIATLQLRDVLGLETGAMPDHYVGKLAALWDARHSFQWEELVAAAATLGLLLGVPRWTRRIPAPLVAIGAVSVLVVGVHALWPSFDVATIGSRFVTTIDGAIVRGIPSMMPTPRTPWGDALSWDLINDLMPSALAIALLGAIESLLSAVIADGMTGTKHDSNAEIVALGAANVVAPLFGGIPATGALARTATNIRAGARSPVAAVTHSVVVLLAILALAPLLSYVPMASLAALLLLVAWNMSELRHFFGIMRLGSKADIAILLTCFALTVMIDMVVAVTVGFILASLLFMRRMAEITYGQFTLVDDDEAGEDEVRPRLPAAVALYQINGPLFFGAAEQAMSALHASHADTYSVMVLDLGRVPAIDTTGYAALDDALASLVRHGKQVVLAGPLPRPRAIFENARFHQRHRGVHLAGDRDAALALATRLATEVR
jgi:SulP family sulfate permease